MKYAEFNIDSDKVEFFNSLFGIESVLLNGEKISRKFSFSGTNHFFSHNSIDYSLETGFKQSKKEIKIDFKENGKVIESRILEVDKKQRIYWIFIGIALGLAGYRILNLLIEKI